MRRLNKISKSNKFTFIKSNIFTLMLVFLIAFSIASCTKQEENLPDDSHSLTYYIKTPQSTLSVTEFDIKSEPDQRCIFVSSMGNRAGGLSCFYKTNTDYFNNSIDEPLREASEREGYNHE